MSRLYGVGSGSAAYTNHLNQILALNPHIKNSDAIRAGSLLRLMANPAKAAPPATPVPDPRAATPPSNQAFIPYRLPAAQTPTVHAAPHSFALKDVQPQDELDFWMLSWLAENSNYLVIPGSTLLGAQANLLNPGNIGLIEDISDLYAQRKSGTLTKAQYDYLRKLRLDQLKKNIGPLERYLFGNQTPHQAIRIARAGGVPATQNISQHANRLKQMASYGKHGGYVLAGVGVAASCMQIADTDSRQEKNEIFVETVVSTGTGLLAGGIIGIFLVSNPIGWGAALVLAAGSAAASYGAGKTAQYFYTASGTKVDLVSGFGVDSVCR